MTITQTATGWTFTQGRETYGPYSTRDEACEALYDLQRGRQQPGDLVSAALDYVIEDERIALAKEADRILDSDEAQVIDWILRETERRDAARPRVVTAQNERSEDGSG